MDVLTRHPRLWRRVAQAVVVAVFVFFLARTLVKRWSDVQGAVGEIGAGSLVVSFVAAAAAVWCSYLSWLALLHDLGHDVGGSGALRVFFVGQLGKYLPGKLWPVVTQMRLGRAYAIDARSSAAAVLVTMLMGLGTALLVTACVVPFLGDEALGGYWWTLLVLPPAAVALWPRVLNALLNRALKVLKRAPMPRPLTARAVAWSALWSLAGWLLYGVHLWALVHDLGGGQSSDLYLRAAAAFAASWAVGFLLAVAPAGVGPREVSLVVILGPSVGQPVALVAAVVSRLLLTAADLGWPAIAVIWDRLHPSRTGSETVEVR